MTIEAIKAQESKSEIVLARNGEPYPSVASARSGRAMRGWSKNTHDIVKCEVGFGLKKKAVECDEVIEPQPSDCAISPEPEPINQQDQQAPVITNSVAKSFIEEQRKKSIILDFNNNDTPFNTRIDAENVMNSLQLTCATHVVIPVANGFGIARMAGTPDPEADKKRIEAAKQERYFMVKIHSPQTENEEEVAQVGCNGEILLIKRGEEVPLPERYIEVLEHGVRDHYKFEPGRPRKLVGKIVTYPFERGKEVTREFFQEWRRRGTEQNTEHWNKQGLGSPERR